MADFIVPTSSLYAGISPAELHFIYGVGSYPYAIGRDTPILFPVASMEGCPAISYFNPWPGSFENGERFVLAQTSDDAKEILIQGCKEDGLVETTRCDARKGFNTVALFYSSGSDYFFARLAEKKWLLKRPMYSEQTFVAPEDIVRETRQELISFFYAPENIEPKSLSALKCNELNVHGDDGNEALIKEIIGVKTGSFSLLPPAWFKLDAQNKQTVLYDPDTFERIASPLPMPAWNLPLPARPAVREKLMPKQLAPDGYA